MASNYYYFFIPFLLQPKVKTKPGQENKLIHPKSRKAEQISREWHRQVRVKHNRKETATKLSLVGEKIAWFRDNMPSDVDAFTGQTMAELVEKYLERFDEELEQIQLKNQIGHRSFRQHASREDSIAHSMKLERQEYETCGIGKVFFFPDESNRVDVNLFFTTEIPDMMCSKNVEYLRKWDGSLKFISNITVTRYSQKKLLAPEPVDPIETADPIKTAEVTSSMEIV